MYRIKSYLIQDIKDGCILQNGISTVVVKDNKLITFLKDLEQNNINEISFDFIKKTFKENYNQIISFLLENEIIFEKSNQELKWNNIWLISNNNMFSKCFEYSLQGLEELECFKKNIIDIKDYILKLDNIQNNDLCIVFLNPFNLREYIQICNSLRENNIIFKTIFFYNHSIYISNFHKKEWFNPCPKCFIYSLETQLRGALTKNDTFNFQTLIDLLYSKNLKFDINSKLNPIDLIPVMDILSRDLKYNENPNSIINNVYEIDLKSSKLNQDISYHWEMCDCYE